MKKRYTEPEWKQIALTKTAVIACSGEKLAFADDNSNDDNKVYW